MKNKNINEKIKNDLNNIGYALQLINSEVNSQIKSEVVSNKTRSGISMLNDAVGFLAQDHIKEQLEQNDLNKKNNLRIANDKIRELEDKIASKFDNKDISYAVKKLSAEIKEALEQAGLYASVSLSFTEYSINLKLEYLCIKKSDTNYSRTQDEINEVISENEKNKKNALSNFDTCLNKKNDLNILLSERNIKNIKNCVNKDGLYFEVKKVSTNPFENNNMVISNMDFIFPTHNFNFNRPKTIYTD